MKIARDELATTNPATDAICFHFQQCAEKYLKAYLIFHGEEYPRKHDIGFIVRQCAKIDARFNDLTQIGAGSLTKYAVGVRYDEEYFPTLDETQQALDQAKAIRAFVLQRFKEKGFVPKSE